MRNGYAFAVAGMKRSGHHAFINWLTPHFSNVTFLNDVEPNTNPYLQTKFGAAYESEVVAGRHRECLIYSYEDRHLKDIFCDEFLLKREAFVGDSGQEFNIIVVRELRSFIASRIRQTEPWINMILPPVTTELGQRLIKALWSEYALEATGETNVVPNKIAVVYDRWFADAEYRRSLAARFGLAFTDTGKERVNPVGKSSFDGTNLNGRASQMRVLERFKQVEGNAVYEAIIADRELAELSEHLMK